jgi:DNA-binding MarR family transcriptional regulator
MKKTQSVFQANRKVEHLLAHHINNAGKHMNRILQQNLHRAGHNITVEQWVVLTSLFDQDGRTPTELCDATLKDKPSITRILKNMERGELIVCMDNPEDGRSKRVFLTKKVKSVEKQLLAIASETERQCIHGITEREIAQCQTVLNKILANPG